MGMKALNPTHSITILQFNIKRKREGAMIRVDVHTFGTIRTGVLAGLLAIGLVAGIATPARTQTYTITDLGTIDGGTHTEAFGLNANAQITGRSALKTSVPGTGCPPRHPCRVFPEHAFIYSAGTMTDLGTLGGIFSWGTGVNSAGDVAGYSTLPNGTYHAFLVHNRKMTDLGSLAANGSSEAYSINNFGEVVGSSTSVNGSGQSAFIYSGGKMMDLGTLGSDYTAASGINNSHLVVGGSDLANGSHHAFLYTNGRITDLGTLGGPQSSAYAINDVGQIVGWAQTKSDATHAFLYSGGKMTDLGAYNIDTVAEAINNSGVIVGQTYGVDASGSPFYHAFIYSGGKFQDLNKLIRRGSGFELTDATGINDTGQIVCDGYNTTNGQTHAFLLNKQ
jgi:probable HAF family extracellular repeat protein